MNDVANNTDLSAVLAQPHAILFIWVSWSGQARHSEQVVDEVCERLAREQHARKVHCYRIDLSEQSGDLWDGFPKWLRKAKVHPSQIDNLTYGGDGSLLWLRNGSIAAVARNIYDKDIASLLETTSTAFADPTDPIRK